MKKIIFLLSSIVVIVFLVLTVILFKVKDTPKKSNDNKVSEKKDNKANDYSQFSFYKKDNLQRYIDYKKNNPSYSLEDVVTYVNLNLDKEPYTDTIKSKYLDTTYYIVNKFNYLGSDFIPNDLVLLDNKYAKSGIYLVREAKDKLEIMLNDSVKENLKIRVSSAYRSYTYQVNLYNRYVRSDGVALADTYSARPGYSEHQSGLVVDLSRNFESFDTFENTDEYKWMVANSYKYGFILRYPKGKEKITTYTFESWHYRYIGVELAKKVHDSGLTFDEYYVRYLENGDQMEIITLCGSLKFQNEMMIVAEKLALKGKCILTPVYPVLKNYEITMQEMQLLKNEHLKRIDLADTILVMNIDNYIGSSTSQEIEYAKKNNKKILYYEDLNI